MNPKICLHLFKPVTDPDTLAFYEAGGRMAQELIRLFGMNYNPDDKIPVECEYCGLVEVADKTKLHTINAHWN